jgi:exodeoxyribonuclease VII large subunit
MQRVDYLRKCLLHPGQRIDAELRQIAHLASRLRSAARHTLDSMAWGVSGFSRRLRRVLPDIDAHRTGQQALRLRLQYGHARMLERYHARLAKMAASLAHLSPHAVLERGYSIVEKSGGEIVRTARQIKPGELLRVTFARGTARTRVEQSEIPED